MVDPASLDDACVDTVKSDDVGCTEECIGEQTEYTPNAVLSEDIQRIVNSQVVFHCDTLEGQRRGCGGRTLGSIIADSSRNDSQYDRPPRRAVSRSRRGSNKTGNSA